MDEQPVDLSPLDHPRFETAVSRITQRALELRRLRRAVVRRGITALVLAMAAGLALWFTAPARPQVTRRSPDLLDWATRDVGADDVLDLGGNHAQ